jgi:hypothetical protein
VKQARLVGGIHRDVSGRANEPLRFFLTIDRGLASGKLDSIEVGEAELLKLIEEAAGAFALIRREEGRKRG